MPFERTRQAIKRRLDTSTKSRRFMTAPAKQSRMSAPLFELFAYQRRWLRDESRFKIAMVARQCGKTKYLAAPEVVEDVLYHESREAKARWVILSRGERQALEAMEEGIKPHYRAHEISFGHGSRITALPSNPDTARGFTANVVLDEFALHRDSRKIWSALFPIVSRPDLKLRILSTPNGK